MNSLLGPIIFLILSGGLYFTFTGKEYDKVKALQVENKQYDEAIANAHNLLSERDKLLAQYNAIPAEDLARIQKLVPDHIDNVRLIIEVNNVLARFGLPPQTVKVELPPPDPKLASENTNSYNSAKLTFQVKTSYAIFTRLIKELESSLRILDISEVKVNADEKEPYEYTFTVNTYWMK